MLYLALQIFKYAEIFNFKFPETEAMQISLKHYIRKDKTSETQKKSRFITKQKNIIPATWLPIYILQYLVNTKISFLLLGQ